LLVVAAIALEGVPEKSQFLMETVLMTDGFGPVYQGGKYNLLFNWMVMIPGIQIEVGFGLFKVCHGNKRSWANPWLLCQFDHRTAH
jgi:hypothetical protein